MPNPKRRQSRARTAKRRTHQKISAAAVSQCSNCASDKEPHRICPTCGYYRGKPVLSRKAAKA